MSSPQNFLKFVDTTLILHDCCHIKKFHFKCNIREDPQLTAKIRFATRKHVEELFLSMNLHRAPRLLFNNTSLIRLRIENCIFMPNFGKINWPSLKALSITHCVCDLSDQAEAEHILSVCRLLESLEIISCLGLNKYVIASNSLKRLVLEPHRQVSAFVISCPKLEQLSLSAMSMCKENRELFVQAIENVLSGSLLLESLELDLCNDFELLVIGSKSLKRLVLENIATPFDIEISCPKLENLKLFHYVNVRTAKLLNLPSSLCADIDFYHGDELKNCESSILEILQQLHHVNEIRIGTWFLEFLSDIKMEGLFSSVLNIKRLTLNSHDLDNHHYGIACLLHNSPGLEKLVIDMTPPLYDEDSDYLQEWRDYREKFWNSNTTVFGCLMSHLKTIKIIDFPKHGYKRRLVLNLVQFLLKNARVLEKMVIIFKDYGIAFPLKVHDQLLSLPRCSQRAVIEFPKL